MSLSSRRQATISKLLLSVFTVADFVLLILFGADMRSSIYGLERNVISRSFCEQPIIISVVIVASILISLVVIGIKEISYRKNTITRSSIKESIDKLNAGLCFAFPNGRTILVNAVMNKLCYDLTGRDLQNADSFWHRISSNDIQNDVECLEKGANPCYRLADGSVWRFSRENLPSFVQITASDITQVYAVNNSLQEKNKDLKALNMRLREYGENIVELTRSRERLETKTRIHGELGQVLLATRRYLLDTTTDAPVDLWKKNIAMLRKEAKAEQEEMPLEMLSRIADATGIKLNVSGEMPIDEKVQKLFMEASAEALTNAVSHAGAKTLEIILTETESSYSITFKNDGVNPTEPIVEGGGLTNLRRKVEEQFGTMEISIEPEFSLNVTVRKESGESNG
jgi:signal transduction histidine kinase